VFSLLACICCFFSVDALAQVSVGVVDMQRALTSTKEGQEAQKKLETAVKKSQGEIDAKKSEYESLQKALEKQRSSLSAKAIAEKEDQLATMEKDLRRSFQDTKEELNRERQREFTELVGKMRKAVEQVGKEGSLTIVFEKNAPGVLYAADGVDVTDKVIKKYDAIGK
jgi:outer membrane protein